jgi:hypothetical protein
VDKFSDSLAILKEAIEELRVVIPAANATTSPKACTHVGWSSHLKYISTCLVIQTSHEVDIEVFKRWVVEGDAVAATASVRRAKKHSAERVEINSTIVFGALTKSMRV